MVSEIGSISEKAILSKAIQFKNGELSIWNVKGSIFSNFAFSYLFTAMNKFSDIKGKDLVYGMAYHQAQGAGVMIKKKFGYKKKILENIVGQGEVLGYGITRIKQCNFKEKKFIFETSSPIAKEHIEIFGHSDQPICHHLRGLLGGTLSFLLEEDMVGIETDCISQGKPKCVFIVKSRKDLSKDKKFISQIPEKIPKLKELGDKRKAKILA